MIQYQALWLTLGKQCVRTFFSKLLQLHKLSFDYSIFCPIQPQSLISLKHIHILTYTNTFLPNHKSLYLYIYVYIASFNVYLLFPPQQNGKMPLISALTNCHTFGALKPQDLLSCSCGSQNGSLWAKIKELEGLHSF